MQRDPHEIRKLLLAIAKLPEESAVLLEILRENNREMTQPLLDAMKQQPDVQPPPPTPDPPD